MGEDNLAYLDNNILSLCPFTLAFQWIHVQLDSGPQ